VKDHSIAQRGSVVLVALCLTIVLGVVVAGYVAVCARTMEMSNRSFCTTSSVHLAEIGMEEALWSLDQALNTPGYTWSGWTPLSSNTITRTLPPFAINIGISGTVSITVDNYNTTDPFNTPPTITATATLTMPDGIPIQKQLVATVKPAALFSNAVGAVDLTLNPSVYFASSSSPGGTVDSYDSSSTRNNGIYTPFPFAPPSIYPDNVNRSDLAIISGSYLTIKNAVILGYATTANSTGAISFTSGTVTSLTPTGDTSTSPPIDYSRISNNANQYAFDIVEPTGAGTTAIDASDLISKTSGGQLGTPGALTPSIYHVTGNLTLSGSDILTINGPVIINVSSNPGNPCNLTIQGSAKIVVSEGHNPDLSVNHDLDGSAQIYVTGNLDIEGGGIDNQTQRPRKLAIFCTKISGSAILNWNATDANPFYGAVYVPYSPLSIGSESGPPNYDMTIHGALVGQSVTFNDKPTIHYDRDLRTATFSVVNTPYDVWQWIVSN
jgi:hypothetical protein